MSRERAFTFKPAKQRKLTDEEKATARDARERLKQQRERIGEPGDPHELIRDALAGDANARWRCSELFVSPNFKKMWQDKRNDQARSRRAAQKVEKRKAAASERAAVLERSKAWNLIQQTAQTRRAAE